MARKAVERNISYDTERARYYVSLEFEPDEQGRRVRRYKTAPTLTQARRLLRAHVAEQATRGRVTAARQTLEQWLEAWMTQVIEPNRAQTTVYGYRKIMDNHLLSHLGSVVLDRLEPRDLQQYYARMMGEEGLSANTVRRHHDLLSSALRTAVRQGLLPFSPTDRVEPPRVQPREARFYGQEDLKRLYRLVEGHWLEPIVRLAGGLGLRREEICGLRWSSVDFQRQTVRIREARTAAGAEIVNKGTKNWSSMRTLYMPDELCALLRREQQRQQDDRAERGEAYCDSGYVAVDRMGRPYSPNAVSLAFTRFVRRNGLPKLTLHGLRHTFATVANAQGAPLFEIGKALGHSTPSTTGRIYTHLVDNIHTATMLKVADALR